ncbi:hypothetical protein [Haloferula sp. A504]|uniref:hypothetical protein n=1 Tax=Haloferula sp. A504 TaxID=3373601 RepID=UPI0031C10C7D|nr:hypothetical protein [Verrucomicrobiaceae bacterium E54]
MKKLTLLMTVGCGILASCIHSRSDHPLLGQIVGRDLTIKRPAVLVPGQTPRGEAIDLIYTPRTLRLIDEEEYNKYPDLNGPVAYEVPVGTPVRIDDVKMFMADSSTSLRVFGLIGHEAGRKEFYYFWGFSGGLKKAPWEPPMMPRERIFNLFYEQAEQPAPD